MRYVLETVTYISANSCLMNTDERLTRRFLVLLNRWVSDSGSASALWTLNPQHLGCRTPFLSCFCSWRNLQLKPSVHPKMSSVETDTRLNILQCQNYTTDDTIAAEQTRQKKVWWKSRLPRKQIRSKRDTAEFHTWGEHCGSLSQQVSRHTRMEDFISSVGVAEERAAGRSTIHHMKHNSQSDSVTLENQAWW